MEHVHGIPGKDCPNPNCYKQLFIPGYKEVWGLSTYSQASESGETEVSTLGSLIQDLKYRNHPSSSSDPRIEKLTEITTEFMEQMLPGKFNNVITVPPNRSNSQSIPRLVARKIFNRGLSNGYETLRKTKNLRVLKNITSFEERFKEIQNAYEYPTQKIDSTKLSILVLDDVCQSGATFTESLRAILLKFPNAAIYGISITYLRDPKVHP